LARTCGEEEDDTFFLFSLSLLFIGGFEFDFILFLNFQLSLSLRSIPFLRTNKMAAKKMIMAKTIKKMLEIFKSLGSSPLGMAIG